MGDVYRARDTRLDRIVAVKVSKTEFGERFEREARAVAALNHSNICTLYDVGPHYLVMEYIEGITHRNIKPANVITADGRRRGHRHHGADTIKGTERSNKRPGAIHLRASR